MTVPKYGGYASELERKMLESRDSGPNEALDDFELSLDLPEADAKKSSRSLIRLVMR